MGGEFAAQVIRQVSPAVQNRFQFGFQSPVVVLVGLLYLVPLCKRMTCQHLDDRVLVGVRTFESFVEPRRCLLL